MSHTGMDRKGSGMKEMEIEKGPNHIGRIVKEVMAELEKNSTERSESARRPSPVPPSDRREEALGLCGIVSPSVIVGSGVSAKVALGADD